jgi:hypothetical protein
MKGEMGMYARQSFYKLKEMGEELYSAATREVMPMFGVSGGCKLSYFLVDEENNECGSFSVWDTRESMEAGTPRIADKFRQLVGDQFESVTVRIFKIYEE